MCKSFLLFEALAAIVVFFILLIVILAILCSGETKHINHWVNMIT